MFQSTRGHGEPSAHATWDPDESRWEYTPLGIDRHFSLGDVWIARPAIALKLAADLRAHQVEQLQPARSGLLGELGVELRTPKFLRLALTVDRQGTGSLWTTWNQARALGRLAAPALTEIRVASFINENELKRVRSDVLDVLYDAYINSRPLSENEPLTVAKQVIGAAVQRIVLERFLDMTGCRRMVVSTQHSTAARAAIHAARACEIPSIYVPHAPIALNGFYRDLPTDVAGLWGPREVDLYASVGADVGRVEVVGTPMHDLNTEAGNESHDGGGRNQRVPLIALSAWDDEVVANYVTMCGRALECEFLIAPHPRHSVHELARFCPDQASIVDGETIAAFRSASVVVQCGSGIALEALLAGLPVVNFNPFDLEIGYPFLRTSLVPFVTNVHDLAGCVEKVTRLPKESGWREEVRNWGRSWCEASGARASQRLDDLVSSAQLAPGPILDGWLEALGSSEV